MFIAKGSEVTDIHYLSFHVSQGLVYSNPLFCTVISHHNRKTMVSWVIRQVGLRMTGTWTEFPELFFSEQADIHSFTKHFLSVCLRAFPGKAYLEHT